MPSTRPFAAAPASREAAASAADPARRAALRRGLRALLGGLAVAAAPGLAWREVRAATFEGVQFDDRISLAGQELLLNGTGLRSAGWFKAYVAALYLPRRAASAAEVLAQAGPKRVRLVMMVDAPALELAKGFDKGVMRNAASAEAQALRPRLARMFDSMQSAGNLKKGDAIDLDYDPARGTTLWLNGRARGEAIAGADFHLAVLRSFVGEHPYHRKLKSGLLGLPVE